MTDTTSTSAPPADLPADPAAFWGDLPSDLVSVESNPGAELPVLDQLGAAPFKKPEKGGFPFLGFFASVYEHVSTSAAGELHSTGGLSAPRDVAP